VEITKTIILDYIHQQLDQKTLELQRRFDDLKSDLGSEHKSSAGDKHETSRAMTQLEQEKLSSHLNQFQQQKETLSKIDHTDHNQIEFGSLILTSNGIFFISIGLGKIEVDNVTLFCISSSSPVGQLFSGRKLGDTIQFNGNSFTIEKVL
jgi:transcription elongation GreA/GreB family factor